MLDRWRMSSTSTILGHVSDGTLYPCPCCGSRTPRERRGFELCPVRWWEEDGQDDADADRFRGGLNGDLSLTGARESFRSCGASDPQFLPNVRAANPDELR